MPRSVRLSVCPTSTRRCADRCAPRPARRAAPRPSQATRAVRTADPSAHGRRSAAIGGGGISSRRAITCSGWFIALLYKTRLSVLARCVQRGVHSFVDSSSGGDGEGGGGRCRRDWSGRGPRRLRARTARQEVRYS